MLAAADSIVVVKPEIRTQNADTAKEISTTHLGGASGVNVASSPSGKMRKTNALILSESLGRLSLKFS